MEFADCIWGNDEIIRKATESLLRYAKLCIENGGGTVCSFCGTKTEFLFFCVVTA
jgi:hypothetical protein